MIRTDYVSCREFILQLNKQASRCNYGDRLEEQMCDRLVAGINNLTLQRNLLEKKDLTFADARKICEQHDELMKVTSSESVTLFQRQKTRPNRPPLPTSVPKPHHDSSGNEKRISPCLSCRAYHMRSSCGFRNAKCHACGKNGHIRRVCKQPRCNLAQPTAANDTNLLLSLRSESQRTQFLYTDMTLQSSTAHKFIVDTGSMESIISIAVLRSIFPQAKIHPTSVQILGVTEHKLPLIGEVSLMVHYKEHRLVPIRFLIAKNSPSILGLIAIRELNHCVLLHTYTISNMHIYLQHLVVKCSNNTGGMNVKPAKLEVDGEPIFLKRRVIPYGQRDGVLQALEKIERDGTITRVTSSTWATPIVNSIKSDSKTPINP
ncbi:unnamed protein product [Echinostoma caproni]|uniref:CCHC-type domain-containing protein n=1 Tax=Echinostoma caproni TaxID=27848 RepID=A0A183AG43_9TREM|nr:unnamed protein product [Echinostoma caproni]